ncbi:max-like protein X [Ptychodera flava]|uniref:max-like protein X n=1 Tax=Ptychodera flava TaxID=63121 RepID=UPI003969E26F
MADDDDNVWRTQDQQQSTGFMLGTDGLGDSSFDQFADFANGDMKIEASSPPAVGTANSNQSRFGGRSNSSNTSLAQTESSSSLQLTDDDEEESTNNVKMYRDKRRSAHTAAEQKRRDAIKKGYEDLQNIVPTCQQADTVGSQKLSKAAILQRSIDYIKFLGQQKKKQEDELSALRKEVMALKIMKANYEQIVKAHQNTPASGRNQISDEVKFQVFKSIMDAQFQSFNASISVASFAELSGCVFHWLEECCKPQALRELVLGVLRATNSQLYSNV